MNDLLIRISKRTPFVPHLLSSSCISMHQPSLQPLPLHRYDLAAPCFGLNTFLSVSVLELLCHHSTSWDKQEGVYNPTGNREPKENWTIHPWGQIICSAPLSGKIRGTFCWTPQSAFRRMETYLPILLITSVQHL